jgi:hypothetical protein
MEDWLNQLYLAKMPGTVNLRASTSFTKSVFVHGAHQIIVYTMSDWITICFVYIILINGLDSHPINFLAAEHRKGKSVYLIERDIRILERVLHSCPI